MSNVIGLYVESILRAKEGHLEGPAHCPDCGMTWHTIAPVGAASLPCPECGGVKGQFVSPVRRDDEHLACRCGNDKFHMTLDGPYCVRCARWLEN